MADIYRKSTLEKLSSPEQLDRMIVVTSPTFWLAMLGGGAIILIALIWAIVGRLPVTVSGNGVYINSDGVNVVYSDTAGVVAGVEVAVGDTVTEGQTIASVTDADTQAAIEELTRRIQEVESVTLTSASDVATADTKELISIKSSLESTDNALQQNLASLKVWQDQYTTEKAKLDSLAASLAAAKTAYYSAVESTVDSDPDSSAVGLAYTQASNAYEQAEQVLVNAQTILSSYQPVYDSIIAEYNQDKAGVETATQNLQNDDGSDPQVTQNLQAALTTAQTTFDTFRATPSRISNITQGDLIETALPAAVQEVSAAQAALDTAQKDYETKKAAYQAYLNGKGSADITLQKKQTEYTEQSTAYATQQSVVTTLEQNIASVQAQIAAEKNNTGTQAAALMEQFETTRSTLLSSLNTELEQAQRNMNKTHVTAHQSGTVLEISVAEGTVVGQGSEVLKLGSASEEQSNVVVCYVPLSSGKKVKVGMTVMVYPTTVNKQEYGHMEATVLAVDEYVTGTAQMKNTLGEDSLVSSFTQDGPVLAVTCALRTDAATASGYYWSSSKAAELMIAQGTLVTVDIVTERKAPIQMVIPLLKEKLSFTQTQS